jgi:hypothetical protein
MFEVFAVGDSRAREVVLNSLRQPGVDFVPWVTRTRKAYKLWATLKGPEWFYRLGSVLRKKCYTHTDMICNTYDLYHTHDLVGFTRWPFMLIMIGCCVQSQAEESSVPALCKHHTSLSAV